MITVERECMGLRLCGGEGDREMDEEMELEEGEAYSYHNNCDSNADDCIDPDVDFSYMDVKIRDVLGHFRKDFEGGVLTAENLGAKFGGYGSFLPTYQRSPVCPQSRSSLTTSPLEGQHRNVAVSEVQRNAPFESSTTAISLHKQQSVDSSKQEKCMPPLQTVEDENSYDSGRRKPFTGVPDQKTLKLKIKLGSSDNLSIHKKAAIYSGLGLDASPSSSLDESPSDSEGMSCGPTEMVFESPTSILQIMTSHALNGDLLLSPLSGDLIHLTEKKKKPVEGKTGKKLLDKKVPKLVDRKDSHPELKSSNSKKSTRKELDMDSVACENLISKTLELPIISGAEGAGASVRDASISHRGKEDLSRRSSGKVTEDKRGTCDPKADSLVPRENNASITEPSSSIGKKKPKGSQSERIQLADPAKESLSSSLVSRSKKRVTDNVPTKASEDDELKSTKKGSDIYRDFFGEIEPEEPRAGTAAPDSGKGQDSGRVENGTKLKERAVTAKAPPSEVLINAAPDTAPLAPVGPPVLIQDNWVGCDKCEKWRLLPVGKDPKSLPKKWLCSMLDWLPGKNRCSVSEVETNGVLSQSYAHAPPPQSNMPSNSELRASTSAAPMNSNATRLVLTPEAATSAGGKKKQSLKQIINSNAAGGDPADSGRKSKQAYEHHSDGGDTDNVRLSKKARNLDIHSADEDRRFAGGSGGKKLGSNGSASDGARIPKPNSSVDVQMKQRRESLEKGDSDSGKSALKKRNHGRDSEDLTRDNDEHRKVKKARVSEIDRKEELRPSAVPTSNPYKTNKSIKGSPAESVSSSPMRSSKPDMISSAAGNLANGEEKGKKRSSKYEGEGEKRKVASDGEAKPRDNERKRMEDAEKRDEKSSRRSSSGRADQAGDDTRIRKSKALPPSGASHAEAPHGSTKLVAGSTKVTNVAKPLEPAGPPGGTRNSSDRRDSFTQAAANAIKEAKDLKHMADRVKASGSNLEGTGLYFQAALKFLHGASLLESSFNATSKYAEMIQSTQTYSSTAKLCEFCAHEYEKSQDMASAALAYKCMEVAYMKVVYSSQNTACRDRQELQTALKLVPPGESPSSSASDVDHVNNTAASDKKASTVPKDENPQQGSGNHIITARNRPNFERLLNFAQDVNSAMEASRRSMAAFDAASSKSGDAQYKEVISYIKRAIDFNFQDIDGLLQLVRIATEAISR